MENRTNAAKLAATKARIWAEIAALQTDGNGVFDAQSWADFGALGSRLTKAGVAWKTCELGSNFTAFMEAAFRDEAERGELEFRLNKTGAHPNSRVRLTKAPQNAVSSSSVPEKKSTVAVKTTIPASSKKLSERRSKDAFWRRSRRFKRIKRENATPRNGATSRIFVRA